MMETAQTELPLQPKPAVLEKPKGRFELPPDEAVYGVAPAEDKTNVQDTGESAPPAEPEAKPEPENKPEKELTPEQAAKRESERRERRAQNRLEKAYRLRAEAEARAKLAEERLSKLSEPKVAPEVAGEPKLADFDYDPEKYAQAKADFAKKQAEKEFTAKQQTEAQKKYRETLVSSWEEKVAAVEEKYDDFDEVVGQITPDLPFTAAIFEAENGADIAYYLGKHPKEAKRIAELAPLSQIREIGKLEAKLLAEPAKPKAPSKAPAPITPLTGAATPASAEPSEDDDTATWIKKRQKQVHSRR